MSIECTSGLGFEGSPRFADLASASEISRYGGTMGFTMGRTKQDQAAAENLRGAQRFTVNVPLTVMIEGRAIPAYTRDLSNRGVYFYLAMPQSTLIDVEFEFVVELPPEITLSTCCRIRCRARLLRKEKSSRSVSGVAAEIVDYSILREAMSVA